MQNEEFRYSRAEKGFILDASFAGAFMLGIEPYSLTNKPLSKYIVNEDTDLFYMHHTRASEMGNKETCELKMFKGDQPFNAQPESVAVKDAEGTIIQYLVTITDILDYKDLEIKLNSLLKFPGEDTNPVLRVSREGIIFYANNAGSHILNLLGCRVYQILPEPWLEIVDNALHNGRTITFYDEFPPMCILLRLRQ